MLFLTLVLVLLVSATTAQTSDRMHCLNCLRARSPTDCTNEVLCFPGQICTTEEYVTEEGNTFYDLGCKLATKCSAAGYMVTTQELARRHNTSSAPIVGKRKLSDVAHACQECCDTPYCNRFLCNAGVSATLECLKCHEVENLTFCDSLQTCNPYEVCYAEEVITDLSELRFNAGCVRQEECDLFKQQVFTDGLRAPCYSCCSENFCNGVCGTENPTSPTPALTTTTATTAQTVTTAAQKTTTKPTTTTSTTATTTTKPTPSTTVAKTATTTKTTTIATTGCPTVPSLAGFSQPSLSTDLLSDIGCGEKDDIVFLVDSSSAVNVFEEHEFTLFVKSIANTLELGPDKARLSYSHFHENAHEGLKLMDGVNPARVNHYLTFVIQNVTYDIHTANFGKGISQTLRRMQTEVRPNAKKYLFIMTKDNITNIPEAIKASSDAKNQGIEIYVFGVGQFHNKVDDLKKVVSQPADKHFKRVDYMEDLGGVLTDILLGRCKANTTQPEHHCLDNTYLNKDCGLKEFITFILDQSRHTNSNEWSKMNQFVDKFLSKHNYSPTAKFGLMTYNDTVTQIWRFHDITKNRNLINLIDGRLGSMTPSGSAYTQLALGRALEWNRSLTETIKVVVIFTNGGSDRQFATLAAATELHEQDVVIFVVNLDHEVNLKEKMVLATDPDVQHILNIDQVDNLIVFLQNLHAVRCKGYTPPASTLTPTTPFPRTTTVCPTLPTLSRISPPQILTDMLSTAGCGNKDDIMFLVDSSQFVNDFEEHEFELFAKGLAGSFAFGAGKARFGFTYFSDKTHPVITLRNGSDAEYVSKTLEDLVHTRGLTVGGADLGGAVKDVLQEMQHDNSRKAKQYLVIFTQDNIKNLAQAVQEASAVHDKVEIFVIAVGRFVKTPSEISQLSKIPSLPTEKHLLRVDYVEQLGGILEDILLGHCRGNQPQPIHPCWKPAFLHNLGCGSKEDITVILDQSANTKPTEWDQIREFIDKLVKNFDISPKTSRIGVMSYNTNLTEHIQFHDFSDKKSLLLDIGAKTSGIIPSGIAFANMALDKTLEWYQTSRPDAIKVAVIFTNGGSVRKFETLSSAMELHRQNITVFVVGVGRTVDLKEQMILATDPDTEHVLKVDNMAGLLDYLEYMAVDRCKAGIHRFHCLKCDGVTGPDKCLTEEYCSEGEICGARQYLDSTYRLVYDYGCMKADVCSSSNKTVSETVIQGRIHNQTGVPPPAIMGRKRQLVSVCLECCESDYCNNFLCGSHLSPSVKCGSYMVTGSHVYFQELEICHQEEVCFSEQRKTDGKEIIYSGGCMDTRKCSSSVQTLHKLGGHLQDRCFSCCNTSFCNFECKQDPIHPIHCMSCSGVLKSEDCVTEVFCNPGEVCAVKQYLGPNYKLQYDYSCMKADTCAAGNMMVTKTDLQTRIQNLTSVVQPVILGRKRQTALTVCQECCDTDFCNNFLCGGHLSSAVKCGSFMVSKDHTYYQDLELCHSEEVCFSEQRISDGTDVVYSGGCMDNKRCQSYVQTFHDVGTHLLDQCFTCCNTSFCNYICKQETTTTVFTTPTTTPSPVPSSTVIVATPLAAGIISSSVGIIPVSATQVMTAPSSPPLSSTLLALQALTNEATSSVPSTESPTATPLVLQSSATYEYTSKGTASSLAQPTTGLALQPSPLVLQSSVESISLLSSVPLSVSLTAAPLAQQSSVGYGFSTADITLPYTATPASTPVALQSSAASEVSSIYIATPLALQTSLVFPPKSPVATVPLAIDTAAASTTTVVSTQAIVPTTATSLMMASSAITAPLQITSPTTTITTTKTTVTTTTTTFIPPVCPTFPPIASLPPMTLINGTLEHLGCGKKEDIVFLVDTSTFLTMDEALAFRRFVRAFAESLDIGPDKARIGYVQYNSDVSDLMHLVNGDSQQSVEDAFAKWFKYSPNPHSVSLLGKAITHVMGDMYSGIYDRPGSEKYLVILTDSFINDMPLAIQAAEDAKAKGVHVILVGNKPFSTIMDKLRHIVSSPTSDNLVITRSAADMAKMMETILAGHCKDSISPLQSISLDPCAGPKLLNSLGCGAKEDIMFIVDRSSSETMNDWNNVHTFIHQLVQDFDISPNASRVGMLAFSNDVTHMIPLQGVLDKPGLLSMIDSEFAKTRPHGDTMTHKALQEAEKALINSTRNDAVKVAVIFTDGGSDSKLETLSSAVELHHHGVNTFVVGVGNEVDLKEQMVLASNPDEVNMLNVQNSDLLLLYLKYLAAIRCRDLGLYSTTPPNSVTTLVVPP